MLHNQIPILGSFGPLLGAIPLVIKHNSNKGKYATITIYTNKRKLSFNNVEHASLLLSSFQPGSDYY